MNKIILDEAVKMGLGKAEKIEDLNDIGKENEENLLKKAEERANLIKKKYNKKF